MARDRQRSKARQRARAAGGQPPPRKRSRSRARDIGLDDATVEESGLEPEIPADTTPDELEQAFPNVDEAHLGEAGGFSGELTDEEFDRAQDEVEIPADLVQESSRRRGLDGEGVEREHKDRGRFLTFIRACIDELSRVQWPDRKHVFQATAVVLGFVLIAGGWLGLMDAIWQPLINAIL